MVPTKVTLSMAKWKEKAFLDLLMGHSMMGSTKIIGNMGQADTLHQMERYMMVYGRME